MHPTLLRFSADARPMLALESTAPPIESTSPEPRMSGFSARAVEDGCTSNLDSYWIDFGGEG